MASHSRLDPLLTALVLVAALAVDMGTTAFNSFFDYYNGTDNRTFNREADKIIVHKQAAPGLAFVTGAGLFLIAGALGLMIGLMTSWWVIVGGAISMAVGFFYTGGPAPISRGPFGEVFAGGFLGLVFFLLVVFIQTGALTPADLLAALPSTLMIAGILTVNNTCDLEGDTAAGRRTLSILLGKKLSSALIPAWGFLTLASLGCLAWFNYLPLWSLLPLAAAAGLSVPVYRSLFRRGFSHATKGPSMGGISRIFLLFSLGMAGALVLKFILEKT